MYSVQYTVLVKKLTCEYSIAKVVVQQIFSFPNAEFPHFRKHIQISFLTHSIKWFRMCLKLLLRLL